MYKHYFFKKIVVCSIIFLFFGVNCVTTMSNLINDELNFNLEINKKFLESILHIEIQRPIFERPPGIEWIKTFGGESFNDEAYDVKLTKDGGFIIAGMTRTYSSDYYEAGWLIKTDSNGAEEWNHTYGEPGALNIDTARSVQQTSDDGYVFTGSTFSYNIDNDLKVWLVKTDANGSEEFNKVYGGNRGFSVQQTKDGGYIICGDGPLLEGLLLKTDNNGNESWRKLFWGYPGNKASGFSVNETIDGGFVFTGSLFYVDEDIEPDIFMIKTDRNGTEEVNVTFGGKNIYARGQSVCQTSDGGYIILGYTLLKEPYDGAYAWLIKTDINGNEVWNKTFGEKDYDYLGEDVLQCDDGGYIIAGSCKFKYGEDSSWLIKTDSFGNKTWQITIQATEQYEKMMYSVDKTVDGGYILSGEIFNGLGDALLVKIASSDAPYNPEIDGPSKGIPDKDYNYTFVTSDPNDEQLYYWIEWGDGSKTGWLGPFDSGVEITESHVWNKRGFYIIKAKAKNTNGLESGFSELEINIPRNRKSIDNLFLRFLEKHPQLFPILKQLLGLQLDI